MINNHVKKKYKGDTFHSIQIKIRPTKSQKTILYDWFDVINQIKFYFFIKIKNNELSDYFKATKYLTINRKSNYLFRKLPVSSIRWVIQNIFFSFNQYRNKKVKNRPRFFYNTNNIFFSTVIFEENNQLKIFGNKFKFKRRNFKLPKHKKRYFLQYDRGNFYLNIIYNAPAIKKKLDIKKSIGLDLGVRNFLTDSEGNTYNPIYKSKRDRIRVFSELCNSLVKRYDYIFVEDLDISGLMGKNKHIGKMIKNKAWAIFINLLENISKKNGKQFFKIDRFFPSSKKCNCGHIYKELKVSERIWICSNCGVTNDRDILAAKNILDYGVRTYS